jgi:transcriptional regulator with XRE-family HTH domain
MSIGERIASLRKEQGLTQARLANVAKLSTSAIAMYETNRRVPDEMVLQQIANALGVPVENLHEGIPLPFASSVAKRVKKPASPYQEAVSSKRIKPNAHVRETVLTEASTGSVLTTLTLNREEARILLFLRMNPNEMSFLQTYITAAQRKRTQLEKAWKLIQEFQA